MDTAKRISNYKKEFKLINQKTVKYKQNGFDTTIKIKQTPTGEICKLYIKYDKYMAIKNVHSNLYNLDISYIFIKLAKTASVLYKYSNQNN